MFQVENCGVTLTGNPDPGCLAFGGEPPQQQKQRGDSEVPEPDAVLFTPASYDPVHEHHKQSDIRSSPTCTRNTLTMQTADTTLALVKVTPFLQNASEDTVIRFFQIHNTHVDWRVKLQ